MTFQNKSSSYVKILFMMSIRLISLRFSKEILEKAVSNGVAPKINPRYFSRKLDNKDSSYKPVKPRKASAEGIYCIVKIIVDYSFVA